jgi:hypothetical protein
MIRREDWLAYVAGHTYSTTRPSSGDAFHETRSEADAEAIVRAGFCDGEPIPSLGIDAGVWLSDSEHATAATGGAGIRLVVDCRTMLQPAT